MTDYFALLQQPRRPWLDLDELKERYQALALAEHPDQKTPGRGGIDFAEVNEAYRCLRDPRLRLQHFLVLEGNLPDAGETIPPDLFDLFSQISAFIPKADGFLGKWRTTSNSLGKSLLESERMSVQAESQTLVQKLRELYEQAVAAMESPNELKTETGNLKRLYLRLTYLGRWLQQVEERSFALASSL
jgi:curved DNA-binding protein CbpA